MQTSKEGLTVEQRLIPKEPSYLIMNLAMSNNAWAKVDQNLTYPGVTCLICGRRWSCNPVLSMCASPGRAWLCWTQPSQALLC